MKFNPGLMIALLAATAISSCNKADKNSTPTTPPPTQVTKIAPAGFNYSTTKSITVTASALTADSKPISGVMMTVYTYVADTLQTAVFKGVTNANGTLTAEVTVPSSCDTLVIDPAFIGLLRLGKAAISGGNSVNAIFGGPSGFGGDITSSVNLTTALPVQPYGGNFAPGHTPKGITSGYTTSSKTNFSVMGTCNSLGVPNYLYSPSDVLGATFLQDMNSALPETVNEPNRNPSWFGNKVSADVVITQASDVWLTFAYEGAGFYNSLGWYKYPTGNPPATINNIDSIHFVFPNCKYPGNGGGLSSGSKVLIGQFQPGYTIGFVVFANAWEGSYANINYYNNQGDFFTDSWLNPETVASLQQHAILLQYQNQTLISFEDYNRQQGSDNDFNDVIFYATSDPITAIQTTNIPVLQSAVDTDGDGVPDYEDAFPTDSKRAYISYYPAQNSWGTVAYEDNWPALGDYDMNDLVVSYQYKIISNAQNNIVEFYGSFAPVASGATFSNGFGVQFPFSQSLVSSVTGEMLKNNYIKLNANGTEAGQTNAVIIPFDNVRNLISNYDGNLFVNTLTTEPKVTGDTSVVYVGFTSPVSSSTFGIANNNPFAISNMKRGYEVHLPNYAPTALANTALFGTQNDASVPSKGIYYVTKDNHPWGLYFLGSWQYPIETIPVNQPYLHFFDWAGSAGVSYTDWYYNTAAGYQNTQYIYNK
jgi:LruC domain-containing protein